MTWTDATRAGMQVQAEAQGQKLPAGLMLTEIDNSRTVEQERKKGQKDDSVLRVLVGILARGSGCVCHVQCAGVKQNKTITRIARLARATAGAKRFGLQLTITRVTS